MNVACCKLMLIIALALQFCHTHGASVVLPPPQDCTFQPIYENKDLLFNWKGIGNDTTINNDDTISLKYSVFYYGSSLDSINQFTTSANKHVIVPISDTIFNYLQLNRTNLRNNHSFANISYVAWVATIGVVKEADYEIVYYSNYTYCNSYV